MWLGAQSLRTIKDAVWNLGLEMGKPWTIVSLLPLLKAHSNGTIKPHTSMCTYVLASYCCKMLHKKKLQNCSDLENTSFSHSWVCGSAGNACFRLWVGRVTLDLYISPGNKKLLAHALSWWMEETRGQVKTHKHKHLHSMRHRKSHSLPQNKKGRDKIPISSKNKTIWQWVSMYNSIIRRECRQSHKLV